MLVVRADAGPGIGSGHVMRCLALAETWLARKGGVTFVTACESERLQQHIVAVGARLVPLPRPHPDPADLQATLAVLAEVDASWVVVDGYHLGGPYQRSVRQAGRRLLVIDDTAELGPYHADLVLNQNIGAESLAYTTDPDTRLLLGSRFALLRAEHLRWRGWQRQVPDAARRVLVTMGGADPENVTLRAIEALRHAALPDVEAKVVVGPANPHLDALRPTLAKAPGLELVVDTCDMASLMAWADVAISNAGSTCWELAFMGLPALLLVLAPNQQGIAAGLHEARIAVNLGPAAGVATAAIARRLGEIARDPVARRAMSRRGQTLVDGGGASRVVDLVEAADWPSRREA